MVTWQFTCPQVTLIREITSEKVTLTKSAINSGGVNNYGMVDRRSHLFSLSAGLNYRCTGGRVPQKREGME
jgi:hypothetical protein